MMFPNGIDQAEMMRLFAEFVAERTNVKRATFRELWLKYEAYGASRTDGGRTRIKSWGACQASHAQNLLSFFGDLAWDQCTLVKAEEYRQWRSTIPSRRPGYEGKPVVAGTRNRELRSAQGCLSYARKMQLIPRNPMTGLQDEPVKHNRDFAIEQDAFAKIVRRARPLLRFFLLLLNETGMRRSELLKMCWTEVDLDAGFMTVLAENAKNGRRRDVPLSVNARAILEMIPADGVNPYVFASQTKPSGHIGATTMSEWFRAAREAAGVTGPHGQAIWLHTLRHTFATDMCTSGGMDIETLMAVCGWSDEKIARQYINIAKRHRQAAKVNIEGQRTLVTELLQSGAAPAKRAPLASEPAKPAQRAPEQKTELFEAAVAE